MWSHGQQNASRWVIPHNPALATKQGCLQLQVSKLHDINDWRFQFRQDQLDTLYDIRPVPVSG